MLKRFLLTDIFTALVVACVGIGLLLRPEAVGAGIKNGIDISLGVLVPALFPFMALSTFMANTDAAKILSTPLHFVTTKLFKLPSELGATVLLSLVGGYPCGAKGISALLKSGKITRNQAERMLCFCVNSGPSFLISAVGAGMLANKNVGYILFASQTIATLLIGIVVSRKAILMPIEVKSMRIKTSEAFVLSVNSAASSMFAMCAFAVLFSGVLSLIKSTGVVESIANILTLPESVVNAVVCGIFEVTSGCVSAARVGGVWGIVLISVAVSFSGLSVLFQIMSCFDDVKISFKPLIIARIAHMMLSTILVVPMFRLIENSVSAFAMSAEPMIHTSEQSLLVSGCLLCMCVIMAFQSGVKITN